VTPEVRFTSGSGVPLVTPFRDGAIDADAFAGLIEFQIDAQTDALIIWGSTRSPTDSA
jgi:4-hydroxy-tetrahydrodipicolinate synthase